MRATARPAVMAETVVRAECGVGSLRFVRWWFVGRSVCVICGLLGQPPGGWGSTVSLRLIAFCS